jgi:autotransporter passenger strand-loop-strand repeat protein
MFHVSSAGKATNVTENGGYVTADEGSVVEFVPNEFTRLTLESGIWATVHSGTTATDTNIGYEGGLTVFYGGSARNTVVAETGLLEVYGGGKAEGVSVASGGMFGMAVGGSATGIVAADGAFLALVIAPDTCAKGTYGGKAFEATDTLSDYTVHAGGWLEVYDGGSADDITVDCYGNLAIYGTGKATQVRENGGYVYVDGSADVKFVANTFSGVYVVWTAIA